MNFRKSGWYVQTKFQKFLLICSDCSRPARKKSKFARMAYRASKNGNFVRIGLKNGKFALRRPICRATKSQMKPLRVHLISITCRSSTVLVSCYQSFDCPQNTLKFSPQLVEDLELCNIKACERSAILAECGWCCSQGTKESVGQKQGIRAHMHV